MVYFIDIFQIHHIFILYITDVYASIRLNRSNNNNVSIYADKTTISIATKHVKILESNLNNSINDIFN